MAIRVGVIGVGYLGRHHARIYAGLEETDLVAVADADIGRAEEVARDFGCLAVRDYRELLAHCEAVSIVTPTSAHHAIAVDCLRAGKDILIEKPITVTVEEAAGLIEEAERTHRILQVGHLERYNPAVTAAWELMEGSGFMECDRLSPFLGRGTDVDVTLDLMIHDVDIVLGLANSRIKEIRAAGQSLLTEKIDAVKVWLEFENGCVAVLTASRLANEKRRVLTAYRKDGYVSVDYQKQEVTRCRRKSGPELSFEVVKPDRIEPLKEELADFADCVKSRRRPKVSGAEATAALEVILRITEIVKAGIPVKVGRGV